MAEPISFPSITRNLGLPLLFSGQSQKEFFINQALETIDALLIKSVNSTRSTPPAEPQNAQVFLVGANPTGDWSDRSDQIAVYIGGSWHFAAPSEGMQLYDRAAQQKLIYRSQWRGSSAPADPTGGAVIDIEARTALIELITTLQEAAVLGPPD